MNRLDGRALQAQTNGSVEMWTLNLNNDRQLWAWTDVGNQLINVGTRTPLHVGVEGRTWAFDNQKRLLNTRNNWFVLQRLAQTIDGCGVNVFEATNGMNQKWIQVPRNVTDTINSSEPMVIRSALDGRVIQGATNGDAFMMTRNTTNSAQNWIV